MNLGVAAKSEGKNPFSVICFICGREYGSHSISIHEESCMEKWTKANQMLPKDQRKSKPTRPVLNSETAHGTLISTSGDYNDAAFTAYQENTLVPCNICGRKFSQTALDHHSNACKPGGLFDKKRENASNIKADQSPEKERQIPTRERKQDNKDTLVKCMVCERKFLPSALQHHSNSCKKGGYFDMHRVKVADALLKPIPNTKLECCLKKYDNSDKFCSKCGKDLKILAK